MDEKWVIMADEAFPYVQVQAWQKKRADLESDTPKPVKVDMSSWCSETGKACTQKMLEFAGGLVAALNNEDATVLPSKTLEAFHAAVLDGRAAEPFLLTCYLPQLKGAMEDVLSANAVAAYNAVFEGIDGGIASWQAKIQKPFDPSLINMNPRFPIARIGFDPKGRMFDKWLSDALGKQIYFDDPKYVDSLIQFYNDVYLKAA